MERVIVELGAEGASRVRRIMRVGFAETAQFTHPSSALAETLAEVELALSRGPAFIVEVAGGDVACVRTAIVPADGLREALTLSRLCVVPAQRGRGHARALVEHCVDVARARGCVEVWADARSQMPDNRPFWTGLGFEVVGTSGRYGIPDLRTHLRLPL